MPYHALLCLIMPYYALLCLIMPYYALLCLIMPYYAGIFFLFFVLVLTEKSSCYLLRVV